MNERDDFSPRKISSDPGVYVFRDRFAKVIYVGKAKSLRKRLATYFQASRLATADPKLRSLINSIAFYETYEVKSESEALLLESRFIKEYSPHYNILMRDDKNFYLVKVTINEPYPRILLTRVRKDDGAAYFGPFPCSSAIRSTVEFLTRYFKLRTCTSRIPDLSDRKHCKEQILRNCSAPCDQSVTQEQYRESVGDMIKVLEGQIADIVDELNEAMQNYVEKLQFEKAATYRDIITNLKSALKQRRKFVNASINPKHKEDPVADLKKRLELDITPSVIECFDNSNFQGTHAVASMVRFVDGKPDNKSYRHFKIKTVEGPDDFASMKEIVYRRYSRLLREKRPLPDLILIDGGKGQLSSALQSIDELGIDHIPTYGLAKKHELLFTRNDSEGKILPRTSAGLKMLQHLRDESHRFAINFHRQLRRKQVANSLLDDIPGIGKKRKMTLLNHFGSVREIRKASPQDIAEAVPGLGEKSAHMILEYLKKN
ncbi:excinuclease ABC subunit C [Lentisphaera araneosa HTCC2155]|uniref:Excinuclease ABC subunit C n=1 Tax=Lentisphaera araneosa HTCC2155 TaxID=313628 RepID=A6DMD6_9BACT|nr:excinuclease ABC subunit UvrC [Lentisphaera araneosa]EDM27126.1 excinuclease ABC subunit C [Lentisphaera araneosa HTCC2155]